MNSRWRYSLAVTYRGAFHLKRLVEDLLDLTRLTARRVEIQRRAVQMGDALREVAEEAIHRRNSPADI